ncbi:HET-domain-containing protein, partial [Lentithecium fluviatile CBS 122367]
AHAWLDGCTKRHLQCQYVNTGYQPPRLLDLSGDNPRLQTTRNGNNEGTPQPYATLSHCWGKNPSFLTLTASNIEQFSKGIPLQDLPRTFQDAVELCKRLHIWYIWIDSLCIIQSGEGSSRDWLHHVTEMGQIYNFCIVNIAATHAEDAHAGLYAQRSPENIRPAVIAHQSSHRLFEEQYLLAHLGMDSFGYHDSPLGRRGWVFQERLLSPRILHFAQEQVFWECSKSYHICETFPAGITLPTDNYYFQPPTVFDLPSGVEFDDPNIIPKTTFNKLIEEYTSRQLTYPDVDKFAAFAGVAEHFDYYLQDQYVAGIFRRYLPQALLWKSSSSSLIPPLARSSYRCPSWSWAKLDCKVEPF